MSTSKSPLQYLERKKILHGGDLKDNYYKFVGQSHRRPVEDLMSQKPVETPLRFFDSRIHPVE